MNLPTLPAWTLASAGCALLLAAGGTPGDPPKFAAPKRIKAGDKFLGEGRLYPSPVLHDIDGDGRADLVVADLIGKVTFAKRNQSGALAAEAAVNDRDGQPLKFHNW
ncbi:MAG: hypothetical protein KDC87_17870 [Planctomycetes bacterium]|nr:hypothetical protein [Planctomycetota bacterium]MCB9870880.1 hypothetical protein [Planctomycetota bacterium]